MDHFQPPEGGSETRVWTTRGRLMRRRHVERTIRNGLKAFKGKEFKQPLTTVEKRELKRYALRLKKSRKKGAHYGTLTGKTVEVYLVLLDFHNSATGRCDPSYKQICAPNRADCDPKTVAKALYALEQAGMVYRIKRVERRVLPPSQGLGAGIVEPLVQQCSNAYVITRPSMLRDPNLLVNQREFVNYDRPAPMNSTAKAKAGRAQAAAMEAILAFRIDDGTEARETSPKKDILPPALLSDGKINPIYLATLEDSPKAALRHERWGRYAPLFEKRAK